MADASIKVDFSCPCGGKLETKDDIRTDSSMVSCKECGKEFGTYAELIAEGKRRAIKKGREIINTEFAKITKNLNKTFKIKL